MAPQVQESFLELRGVVVVKVTEEALQHFPLFVSEIRQVVQFVQVAQVGQHPVGIGHVLVNVVEVGQQQLSPPVELVERLLRAGDGTERTVQQADGFYGVGHLQAALPSEEVADGDVRRAPDGLPGQSCQLLVQKQRGALVREDDDHLREVGAILFEDVLGNIF